jgi:magnesium transporter
MAVGEIGLEDWPKLTLKEALVSAGLGITVALFVCGPAILQGGFGVGMVVGISAALTVLVGGIIGMVMPFLLRKLGFDPATSSSPLITSILDILGILIYFELAMQILNL